MVQLDVTIVNVALQHMGGALGGSVTGLQWRVHVYTTVFACLIPAAGALGDRFGAKRTFTAGFIVFTFASIGCATAPTLTVLIAARATQGIGVAALVPCSLALLNHTYHRENARTKAVAIWAASASLGIGRGPIARRCAR